MNGEMHEFEEKFGDEDPSTVSKFKKYKNKYYQYIAIGLIILIAAAIGDHVFGLRIVESPYPKLTVYAPLVVLLVIAFIVYLGYRDVDMTSERALYYEMSKSIETFGQENYNKTATHVEEIGELISNNSVGVFSERKENEFLEYKNKVEDSDDKGQLIDEKFEGYITSLIEDISSLSSLDELSKSLKEDENEFDKSTTADAIGRLVGGREVLIIFIIISSLAVFNFVSQQLGFYFAMISLSIMQLISNRRD